MKKTRMIIGYKGLLIFLCTIGFVFIAFAGSAFAYPITDFAIVGDSYVTLGSGVTVYGSVGSNAAVWPSDTATITGEVRENGDFVLPPAATFIAEGDDILTGENESTQLYPDSYGRLHLGGENELYLSSGDYYFDRISIAEELDFYLDISGGDINIFSSGYVLIDEDLDVFLSIDGVSYNSYADVDPVLAGSIFYEFQGPFFVLGHNGELFGTVYGPNGGITIGNNCGITGALYSGAEVTLGNYSGLSFEPANRFQPVPEPATILLLCSGFLGIGLVTRGKFSFPSSVMSITKCHFEQSENS